MNLVIGSLFALVGAAMAYTVFRAVRAEGRARPHVDPTAFSIVDVRIPEYRAKSAPLNPLANLRREPREFEPLREPRNGFSSGLFTQDHEDPSAQRNRSSPALRIHGVEPDGDGDQKTLGL